MRVDMLFYRLHTCDSRYEEAETKCGSLFHVREAQIASCHTEEWPSQPKDRNVMEYTVIKPF